MFKNYAMFLLATVLLMLPLTGYTMSYNLEYVEGVKHQQEITLQTDTDEMAAFVSESVADLFRDDIVAGSRPKNNGVTELSMATEPDSDLEDFDCMAGCYRQPEVGWRGSL